MCGTSSPPCLLPCRPSQQSNAYLPALICADLITLGNWKQSYLWKLCIHTAAPIGFSLRRNFLWARAHQTMCGDMPDRIQQRNATSFGFCRVFTVSLTTPAMLFTYLSEKCCCFQHQSERTSPTYFGEEARGHTQQYLNPKHLQTQVCCTHRLN